MPAVSPYRAISDHTRRQILDLLHGQSLTAGAIAGHFSAISRPAVSKHLAILRRSRLVQVRKEGREQVYTLNAAPLQEVYAWLGRYENFWDEQLNSFKSFVEGQMPPEEIDGNES